VRIDIVTVLEAWHPLAEIELGLKTQEAFAGRPEHAKVMDPL
jgi:hypothetical protein